MKKKKTHSSVSLIPCLKSAALSPLGLSCTLSTCRKIVPFPNAHSVSRYQGLERGIQAYYRPSSSPSVHGFLAVGELDRPVESVWSAVCQLPRSHMYNRSVRSVWTRPLDDSTQLGEFMKPAHRLFPLGMLEIQAGWGKKVYFRRRRH